MMKRAFQLSGHFTSGVEWPFFFAQGAVGSFDLWGEMAFLVSSGVI